MESASIKEKRLRLAEAIRNGEPIEEFTEVPIITSADKEERLKGTFVPRCIYGDWYYVEDSLKNPYVAYFINRCTGYMDYYKDMPLSVPPEKHHCRNIDITVDDNTDDIYLRILDRYAVLCLDISAIRSKFKTQASDELERRRALLSAALRRGNVDCFHSHNKNECHLSSDECSITIPDTMGDTQQWGAYEGTLSPERVEKTILNYREQTQHTLSANAQTSLGMLVVEFIDATSDATLYASRVSTAVLDGNIVNLIRFSINDSTPDKVYGLWNQQVIEFDTSEAKRILQIQSNRRIHSMDNMDNNVNNDAVAARRRALAEALRTGEPVIVTASGEVETKEDAMDMGMAGIQVPDGKLA